MRGEVIPPTTATSAVRIPIVDTHGRPRPSPPRDAGARRQDCLKKRPTATSRTRHEPAVPPFLPTAFFLFRRLVRLQEAMGR